MFSGLRSAASKQLVLSPRRSFYPRAMSTLTPMEDSVRTKLNATLSPISLEIHNDSHLHSHHRAMAAHPAHTGATEQAPETHFRVTIVSSEFEGKMQPARHRMVYKVLKDELAQEGGVHALQIVARTPAEMGRISGTQEGDV